ncbi:MAG: helix-turn-helix domain-containing protein [Desulfosalsimonas sp.]
MKKTRAQLAATVNITGQWLSDITNGRGRPSWELAKDLARTTGSNPQIWMEGNISAMQQAVAQYLYNTGGGHEADQNPQ